MGNLYTIGYEQRSLREFAGILKKAGVTAVADVRRYPSTQHSGWATPATLEYVLSDLANIKYIPSKEFAPSAELFKKMKNGMEFGEYATEFLGEISKQSVIESFDTLLQGHDNLCLLCFERDAGNCHRKVVVDFMVEQLNLLDYNVTHL